MKRKSVRCVVTSVAWISPTVLSVVFRPLQRMSYRAGQFLSLAVPTANGGEENFAVFLSRAPEEAERQGFEIWVRQHVDSQTVVEHLRGLTKGSTLLINGPFGNFGFHSPRPEQDVVFAATASGLAPIKAIIQSEEFRSQPPRRTFLLYGARHESEVLFRNELEKLGVIFIPCITRPSELRTGFWGRIRQILERDILQLDKQTAQYYIAGGSEMVEDLTQLLTKEWGIERSAILTQTTEISPKAGLATSLKLVPLSFIDPNEIKAA